MKKVVDQIVSEYAATRDTLEAVKCVRELDAPNFGHEVVKRAVKFALSKDSHTRKAVSDLLKALVDDDTSPSLTNTQIALGFKRLFADLPDLVLDVPNAEGLLRDFQNQAIDDGLLEKPVVAAAA